LLIISYLA